MKNTLQIFRSSAASNSLLEIPLRVSDSEYANLLASYKFEPLLAESSQWFEVYAGVEIRMEMQTRYSKSASRMFTRNTGDLPIDEISFYLDAEEYYDGVERSGWTAQSYQTFTKVAFSPISVSSLPDIPAIEFWAVDGKTVPSYSKLIVTVASITLNGKEEKPQMQKQIFPST